MTLYVQHAPIDSQNEKELKKAQAASLELFYDFSRGILSEVCAHTNCICKANDQSIKFLWQWSNTSSYSSFHSRAIKDYLWFNH